MACPAKLCASATRLALALLVHIAAVVVPQEWGGGEGQFVLVTGASSNHYASMLNMIASARETYDGAIVAWDLGLSADEVDDFLLQSLQGVELRTFNYSACPQGARAPTTGKTSQRCLFSCIRPAEALRTRAGTTAS